MLGYQGRVKAEKPRKLELHRDEFAAANFLSLRTGTSSSSPGRVHKDLENSEIDLNSPPVEYEQETDGSSTTDTTTEEAEASNSNNNRAKTSCGGRLQFTRVRNFRDFNSKFKQEPYRGVRHRSELNKWVTEIRPTAHKRKIWLGTYKSPEEAARAYDVGIYYTGKKIPLNFPESVKNLPELPQGSWEELAPFVKKQALTAAKRARVQSSSEYPQTTPKLLPKAIAVRG